MKDAGAIFSNCGRYRYRLWRIWDPSLPTLLWILYNPSTADAKVEDPTLRRCMDFTRQWGYGGLTVVNRFAYRATNPRQLNSTIDPVGPENTSYVQNALLTHREVMCAWGLQGGPIPLEILCSGAQVFHLGLCRDGSPKHPLYLAKNTVRIPVDSQRLVTT